MTLQDLSTEELHRIHGVRPAPTPAKPPGHKRVKQRAESIIARSIKLEREAHDLLMGLPVRFRWTERWPKDRTGIVRSVSIHGTRITLGIEVDRLDGLPGKLAETYWTDLNHVEFI